jgi:hypothetical protein
MTVEFRIPRTNDSRSKGIRRDQKMTAKQYAGLLALCCIIASPFVLNQWLKFAKTQHEYQAQLQAEKLAEQISTEQKEQKAKNAEGAVSVATIKRAYEIFTNSPIEKQWERFAQAVDYIKWRGGEIPNDQCDELAAIIRRRDFAAFNAFVANLPDDGRLHLECSFPDLSDPNLTAEDAKDLSQFVNPDAKERAEHRKDLREWAKYRSSENMGPFHNYSYF